MPNFTTSRVQRKVQERFFTKSNYRQAWPYLMEDFEERCAYSMQHISHASGPKNMQVDHFNPRRKKDDVQKYSNLFLSTSHCNNSKSNQWTTNKERAKGIRFLNCCKEFDYGVHIFEDPDTHEVVGITSAGKYHVDACDLNADHFTKERKKRAEIWETLEQRQITLKGNQPLPIELRLLKEVAGQMIPKIPYLSGDALRLHREEKRALESFLASQT